jgi:hypothetical protein
MIRLTRPQGLWIKLWKTFILWKKKTKEQSSHYFHRQFFPQPVEKWKTLFK